MYSKWNNIQNGTLTFQEIEIREWYWHHAHLPDRLNLLSDQITMLLILVLEQPSWVPYMFPLFEHEIDQERFVIPATHVLMSSTSYHCTYIFNSFLVTIITIWCNSTYYTTTLSYNVSIYLSTPYFVHNSFHTSVLVQKYNPI